MKQRQISNSPLMDPAVCVLVLITPDPLDPASIDSGVRTGHQRTISTLTKAADIANVPVLVLTHHALQQERPPPARWEGTLSLRQFVFEENGSPWSHKGFVKALTELDRSILILAGFWLEHQILATALHALAESYDVYILLDATPPRSRHASEPSRDRLNQAGATPVITSQVIHEWSLEAPDASKRAALLSLLPPVRRRPMQGR
jgi:nicotinamidase-related amidase